MSQDVRAEDSKETHLPSLKAHKTVIGGALNCPDPLSSVLKAVSSLLIGYSGTVIVFRGAVGIVRVCLWVSAEDSTANF